ncbi:MAG: ABC transporter substrate-binding protein [Actinobacteria bacterium]|nr:ABC transporter substrate-binding protein [Actinomycetota bacterium]
MAPNSWTDPEVVKAFAFIKDLADKYFEAGNLGMNHTQSQTEVMIGKAGMIACGDWFPKEMTEVWPEGVEIRGTGFPFFEDSSYPQNVYTLDHDSATFWVIPEKTTQEALAVDFLKILYSEQIQKFTVNNTGARTVYDGSMQWLPDNKFGQAVKSMWEHYQGAAYTISHRETFDIWYPSISKVIEDSLLEMLNGKETPEDVCKAIQKACDDYKADSKNILHKFSLGI